MSYDNYEVLKAALSFCFIVMDIIAFCPTVWPAVVKYLQ